MQYNTDITNYDLSNKHNTRTFNLHISDVNKNWTIINFLKTDSRAVVLYCIVQMYIIKSPQSFKYNFSGIV